MRGILGTLFASLTLLSACASKPPLDESVTPLAVSKVEALPQPTIADIVDAPQAYVIGPLDKLEIDVFGIDGLMKREVQADAGGMISLPLAGSLQAAGKTPAELASALATRLRTAYVRDPQVSVNVKEAVSRTVTVEGEVREPGIYPILGNMTLLRSIASAKGPTEFASTQYVVIFRTVGGQRYAALYNLEGIRRGYYSDPTIYGNDVVVVGESSARRMMKNVLTIAPTLLAPLIYVLRQ